MSGIAGIYYPNGRPVDAMDLHRMVESMADRGVDGRRIWHEGNIGFGHCMLHTTPESLHEEFPMKSRCGNFVLTADARIDNRDELTSALRPPHYNGHPVTDGELILLAYEKWGRDCPKHLVGDYAFAIWDRCERRLFCVRDHMGIKPFYYVNTGDIFAFASTLSSLLRLEGVPKELNYAFLGSILIKRMPDNTSTFYTNVLRLPPAHSYNVSDTGLQSRRYWRLDPFREILYTTDAEYEEQFRDVFYKAVSVRLRSANGKVASTLSGGLDSSSVVSAATHIIKRDGPHQEVRSYSCVFPSMSKKWLGLIDERKYVDAVVSHHQLDNTLIYADALSPVETIDRVLAYSDEPPFQFNLYLHLAMYEAAAADGSRIILDGIDGDNAVSHGWVYLYQLAREARWTDFTSIIKRWGDHFDSPKDECLSEAISPIYLKQQLRAKRVRAFARGVSAMSNTYDVGLYRVLQEKLWRQIILQRFRSKYQEPDDEGIKLDQNTLSLIANTPGTMSSRTEPPGVDFTRFRHCIGLESPLNQGVLEAADFNAQHLGVEPRYPFYDKNVLEYCVAIPPAQKIHDGRPRSILRRSLRPILPELVVSRMTKSKLGFNLQERLLFEAKETIVPFLAENIHILDGVVEMESMQRVIREFEKCSEPRENNYTVLDIFMLVSVLKWMLRISVAGRASPSKNGSARQQRFTKTTTTKEVLL